jgi:hypothetical protein
LLTEVCRSSASYDMHAKLDLYQAAKIPEYLATLLFEQKVRLHILVKGCYKFLSPNRDGLLCSRIFSGLWLDSKALLARNLRRVLVRLQEELESPDHERQRSTWPGWLLSSGARSGGRKRFFRQSLGAGLPSHGDGP